MDWWFNVILKHHNLNFVQRTTCILLESKRMWFWLDKYIKKLSDLMGGNPRKIIINNNTIQPPSPSSWRDRHDRLCSNDHAIPPVETVLSVSSSVRSSAGTLGPNFRWLANFVDSAVYSMEYRCEHNTYQHTAAPNYSLAYNISGWTTKLNPRDMAFYSIWMF